MRVRFMWDGVRIPVGTGSEAVKTPESGKSYANSAAKEMVLRRFKQAK
jgi:hypothetical protein